MSLTPENIEKARQMRRNGMGWTAIVRETGISMFVLRAQLDPTFRERRREQVRHWRYGKKTKGGQYANTPHFGTWGGDRVEVPADRLEDQARLLAYEPPSVTAALCGDPPPWRSALAQKQLRLVR